MTGRTFSAPGKGKYRYGFNGKERDDELNVDGGSYDFGARIYDGRLGRWLSPDPKSQFIESPYFAFVNSPICIIDPDGAWIPTVVETKDKSGKVTGGYLALNKEEGDDAASLSKNLGVKLEEANELFKSMGSGNQVKVPEAIAAPINAAINDAYNPSENDYKNDSWLPDAWESNYNCWESTISISKGETPDFGNVMEPWTFSSTLRNEYENVSEDMDKWKFGRTAIRFGGTVHRTFGGDYNRSTHGATYLGMSNNGTIYVWTKNGMFNRPKVATLNSVIHMYGDHQGVGNKKGEGGFYNYIGN